MRIMNQELIRSLSKYVDITKELEEAINESAFIKTFGTGTILLKDGELSNECFFILKGCIRCYYFKDGEERTSEFYTEDQAVTLSCYGKKIPSDYYLQCVEDTIACVGTPELEEKMLKKYPVLEKMGRIIADAMMTQYQDTLSEFKTSSPEERYINLLKNRSDLIQRVPQHQIASYLGIKPESLSRIRRRIMDK
jgi:CRP-like cAMP-binding protein